MSLDDLASNEHFGGGKGRRETITWLPEPEPRERVYRVISVDDHVVEPPDAFTGRFPKKYAGRRAPRRADRRRRRGVDVAGPAAPERRLQRGGRAAVDASTASSRPASTRCAAAPGTSTRASPTWTSTASPRRCASRRSCPASSASASRCGRTTTSSRSPRCARTTTGTSTRGAARIPAASSRTRSRTCAIPQVAADEIRRNAARGFKAVTFSEAPDKLGLPTIHSGYWDPLFAACEETETVLCLHVGSSGTSPTTSADAPPEIPAVLFGAYGMYSAVDWLYSKIPVRFPDDQDLPVGRRHRLGRRHHRPPRPLLQVPTRLPADVA